MYLMLQILRMDQRPIPTWIYLRTEGVMMLGVFVGQVIVLEEYAGFNLTSETYLDSRRSPECGASLWDRARSLTVRSPSFLWG